MAAASEDSETGGATDATRQDRKEPHGARRGLSAGAVQRKLPVAISIAALVVALLGVTGPAVAHGVRHALFAHNADKVDGKHAVAASASVAKRSGKLVATSGATGRLPNNIIAKAPDANLLDGLDSADLASAGRYAELSGFFSFTLAWDCDVMFGNLTGPSVTVNVGPSGLVAVWAQAQIQDFGTSLVRVQLLEETGLSGCPTILEGNAATNGGIDVKRTLPGSSAGTTGFGAPLVVQVAPGLRTFTLRYGMTPDAGFSGNVSQRRLWVQPL